MSEFEQMRALLRDPAAGRADDARRKSAYLLRTHVLEKVSRALARKGLRAMLVKGAALALTTYAPPWVRDMDDIDLLVGRGDKDRVVRTLVEAGCELPRGEDDRPLTVDAFGETLLVMRTGVANALVEVHTGLDKLVDRPIDYDGIFARGAPAPGLTGLRVPSAEDHALLVAMHAAGHEMRHAVGLCDLHLLLRGGLDLAVLEARARAFRLETVLFVALSALVTLGSDAVPHALLARLEPSPVRRRLLALAYDVDGYPVARGPLRLGLSWVARQTPLRDDLGRWAVGVARYAALRAIEGGIRLR